jgi:hypothetical protein
VPQTDFFLCPPMSLNFYIIEREKNKKKKKKNNGGSMN